MADPVVDLMTVTNKIPQSSQDNDMNFFIFVLELKQACGCKREVSTISKKSVNTVASHCILMWFRGDLA